MARRNTTFRSCVPVPKRVAIALWKLGTPSEYHSIAHLFGVGITTVAMCHWILCCCEWIPPTWLHTFPQPREDGRDSQVLWTELGLLNCIGAIDSSYIQIMAPQEYATDYFNCKGWHSIVLQAVVDGTGLFWDVCAGSQGSVHDAKVLRQSHMWQCGTSGNLTLQGD